MKIVYVFRSLAVRGGIERILTDKMNWLVEHGHEVTMLTTDQGSHPVPYTVDKRVRFTDLGICFHYQYRFSGLHRLFDMWRRNRRYARMVDEQLRKEQADVIVCATTSGADVLARKKGRTPLVVESHSIFQRLADVGRLRFVQRFRLLRALRSADVLVALTEGDAVQWRKKLDHVVVIPNMVHAPKEPQRADLKARRAIFAGRFDAQKQVDHLLRVWQIVQQRFPDWVLAVYGEGPLRGWMQDEVRRLGLHVELNEPASNIFQCYAQCSVLLLTSEFEPFGLVLTEAMSCGLPVVAYDCPYGPRTIINDGEDGLLVPAGDVGAFAEALARLMADESLRRQFGARAMVTAKKFDAALVMPRWVDLFQNLTKR